MIERNGGETTRHIAARITYAHPMPTDLMMISIIETRAAPSEHRTRLFCDDAEVVE